jgi:hypothetical protein
MANDLKYGTDVRNDMLEQIEVNIVEGAAAGLLQIFAHTTTPNVTAADGGTKLVEITLPDPQPFAAAAAGAIAKTGTWQQTSATASGNFKYFRIKTSAAGTGTNTTLVQGTAGLNTGTFDLELDSASVTAGQTVTISTFSITGANGD